MTKIQDDKGEHFCIDPHEDFEEEKNKQKVDFNLNGFSDNDDNDVKEKKKLEAGIFCVSVVDKVWKYRGEGGANLVISLSGEKQIVRFSKSKYPEKDHDAKILEIAYYANEVMKAMIGKHYVRPLSIGVVSNSDFEHVRQEAQQFRPLERCKKDIMSHRVIMSHDCVFLTSDLIANTVGDTFSVEIKPKQGWHSTEKSTCAVDLCSRCLKQFAKLQQGKIERISRYCPLDLYSGDLHRMKRAIFDLFENPHNRFKIYKNGDIIYTENMGDPETVEHQLQHWFLSDFDQVEQSNLHTKVQPGLDSLAALLCTVLLTDFDPESFRSDVSVSNELIEMSLPKSRSSSCDTKNEPLPIGCILQRILSLQRHTDISDNEAKTLCEKLQNNLDDLERLHQLILWNPMTIFDKFDKSVIELKRKGLNDENIDSLHHLQRFLLSVTAKDVSLLITFRQVEDLEMESQLRLPVVQLHQKLFRVMISVIDLDPKPVHRITSWVKRKEDWLKIYRRFSNLRTKAGADPNYEEKVVKTKPEKSEI